MNSSEVSKLLWSTSNGIRQTSSQQQQSSPSQHASLPQQATTTATPHSGYITLGYRHIAALVTVAVLVGFALAAELNDSSSYNTNSERSAGCSTFAFRGNNKDLIIRDNKNENKNKNQGLSVFANNVMNDDNDEDEDPESSFPRPRIAWLMSFPNSGTSFTLKMIRHVSQRVTASNYGEENRDDYGNSVPVYPNSTDGPFWLEPKRIPKGYAFPTAFALTKTHCGGRCEKCGPSNYIENPHSFLIQCRSGKRVETDKNGERKYVDVQYDANLVHKAVHLIRNPFDNIVSRFHLEYHGYMKRNETQKQTLFPNSREGFRNFCHYLDLKFQVEEKHSRFVESHIMTAMQSVPCHGDFFRYVQWHNLAFVTTHDLIVPTYVLHYENYEENFNQTVAGLLNFLQLDWENEAPEFIKGKEYSEYFTSEEQKVVRTAMEALSSTTTWNNIHHYFD